jgi:hypothetical protein
MGRPRKHPEGTTTAQRTALHRQKLAEQGGATKTFALSARALEGLALARRICGEATDTAVVERLLRQEAERLKALGQIRMRPPGAPEGADLTPSAS